MKKILKSFNQINARKSEPEMIEKNEVNKGQFCACISTALIADSGLIIIRNTGESDAKNVRIVLDDVPLINYPGILNKKEYYTIAAQSTLAIQACIKSELFPSKLLEITWNDDEDENKICRISLYN